MPSEIDTELHEMKREYTAGEEHVRQFRTIACLLMLGALASIVMSGLFRVAAFLLQDGALLVAGVIIFAIFWGTAELGLLAYKSVRKKGK